MVRRLRPRAPHPHRLRPTTVTTTRGSPQEATPCSRSPASPSPDIWVLRGKSPRVRRGTLTVDVPVPTTEDTLFVSHSLFPVRDLRCTLSTSPSGVRVRVVGFVVTDVGTGDCVVECDI